MKLAGVVSFVRSFVSSIRSVRSVRSTLSPPFSDSNGRLSEETNVTLRPMQTVILVDAGAPYIPMPYMYSGKVLRVGQPTATSVSWNLLDGDDGDDGGRPGVVAAHGIDLSDGCLDIDGGEGPERRLRS